MVVRNLDVRKEVVITIANGDLAFIVWQDKNRRQVFYKCEPMSADDIAEALNALKKLEEVPALPGQRNQL